MSLTAMEQLIHVTDQTQDQDPPDITVVVPVYRGAGSIGILFQRLRTALQKSPETFEVIFVDDRGSSENWAAISELAHAFDEVRGVRLSRNFGQHAATLCGIARARPMDRDDRRGLGTTSRIGT